MLTVTNGFKLYTAAPSSHDYRFQATPSPVMRGVTAPLDPNDSPPTYINDMNEPILAITPTAADCTRTSFSFRLLSDPQTVRSLSSAETAPGSSFYRPTIDGILQTHATYSYEPFKYAIYAGGPETHVGADGSVYYTTIRAWVAFIVNRVGYEEFKFDDVGLLDWAHDILLIPQSVSQQEYLYTVSGS